MFGTNYLKMLTLAETAMRWRETSYTQYWPKCVLLIALLLAACQTGEPATQQAKSEKRQLLLDLAMSPTSASWKDNETLIVTLPLGFTSTVRFLRAYRPNSRLFIFHSGHAKGPREELESITLVEALLDSGYDVAWLFMPLLNLNELPGSCSQESRVTACLPCYYEPTQLCMFDHDWLALL